LKCSVAYFKEDFESPYCARISLVPEYEEKKNDDAFQAYLEDGNEYIDVHSTKAEFIFILDRSLSMRGERMR
jgi:hypothetical protein